MTVIIKREGIEALRAGKEIKLSQLIDPKELVTYHDLKLAGIKPETMTVDSLLRERFNAMSSSGGILLGAHPDKDDLLSLPAEDVYIVIAHETRHVINENRKRHLTGRVEEDDAAIWESMQATKFEWDENDYAAFVRRIIGGSIRVGEQPYHSVRSAIAERKPVFFAVRRRPDVIVQSYRRKN